MRRSPRQASTMAAVCVMAFASTAGCGESGDAAGEPVGDLTGVWSGTWTGPGSSGFSSPLNVAVLELTQGSGRVVGGFRIMGGPPFYDSVVYQGSFQGDMVRETLSFQLDFGAGSYRGTGRVWRSAGRTLLALEYAGASCCGYPNGGSDTLTRLDSCPAEHTACVAPSPYCADLLHDDSNCGACGYVCARELFCDRGRCAWPPTPACTGPLPLEPAVAVQGLPSLPGSYYANDVVLADLNGDGHLDAAVAHDAALAADDDVVSVLLNDGAGTLLPGGTFPVAGRPISLAVGDFDGDGVADLASLGTADRWPEPFVMGVSVLPGNGDGSFGPPIELPAGACVRTLTHLWQGLAAADLDGDGRSDLAAVNPADDTLIVFLSRDDFAAPVAYAALGAENGIAAADLDGDGRTDVAIGISYLIDAGTGEDRTGVLLFRGNGDGTFREGIEVPGACHRGYEACAGTLAAGDLDRDGHTDLVQLGVASTLFAGGPDGTLAPTPLDLDGSIGSLADFDRDGNLDLVTLPRWDPPANTWALFYRGAGDGGVLPAFVSSLERAYERIAVGDLDGDGRIDLVLAGRDPEPGRVWVMFACSP